MRILKYTINYVGITSLSMPKDSIILSCQKQIEDIALWALVDEKRPLEKRLFEAVMTDIPVDLCNIIKHIATVRLDNFSLVTHIFEIYK